MHLPRLRRSRRCGASFPWLRRTRSSIGRSILSGKSIHVRDVDADRDLYQALRDIGMKSLVGVPLLRDGVPLGVIGLSAREAGGFSDSQIALLQTFAEQAVIAIGSAETYRALQERTAALAQRNSEYGERIEHQSATIDVLKAMSASPGDTQPVFDLIVRRAQELCNGMSVGLFEYDGALMHIRAAFGGNESASRAFRRDVPHGADAPIVGVPRDPRSADRARPRHGRGARVYSRRCETWEPRPPYRCRCCAMAWRSVPSR